MAFTDVVYSPESGFHRTTLHGTVVADAQVPDAAANDQIVAPDAVTVTGQLGISGPVGNYTLWHISAAGVITPRAYEIANNDAPVLTGVTLTVLSPTSIRFDMQTDKNGGPWYLAVSSIGMPADGDVIDAGNLVGTVTTPGLQSVTVTGLDATTLYYFKAVHVDGDDNVSNYVSAQQSTYTTGSVGVDVVFSPGPGYVFATLIDGFDSYAVDDLNVAVAAGSQIETPTTAGAGYFDNLGNYWLESGTEVVHDVWIRSAGIVTLDTFDPTGLSTIVPQDLQDQEVLNAEPNTWVQMPDDVVLAIDASSSVLSSVDNSLVEQQWSTDGGNTFDGFSTAQRTGLVAGNVGQFRLRSGLDFLNTGPDYENLGRVSIQTASFQLRTVNRNAVVPTITQHVSNQSVTAGATATFSGAATGVDSWEWVEQLLVDDVLTEVVVAGAVTNQLAIAGTTVADDNGRNFAAYAISPEGGRTRSPVTGFAALTVIADATRIVIPAGVVTGRGQSAAGTTVPVNVWADDNGRRGQWLYSTNVALAASGVTNLDSNQNGAPGTIRWYSFPSATGGNSEAAFQTTVQAIP